MLIVNFLCDDLCFCDKSQSRSNLTILIKNWYRGWNSWPMMVCHTRVRTSSNSGPVNGLERSNHSLTRVCQVDKRSITEVLKTTHEHADRRRLLSNPRQPAWSALSFYISNWLPGMFRINLVCHGDYSKLSTSLLSSQIEY